MGHHDRMGFEVLDSRGPATSRPDDVSSAAVDVVQLDDSPATAIVRPHIDRRATARVGALVVVALVLGVGLGGLAVRRHEQDQQRQAQNAVLSVSAIFNNLSSAETGVITTATVVADLTNYGPVPVRVVTTTADQPESIRVQLFTSPPEVAPGGTARVSLSVPINCDVDDADPRVTVPVLTRDQRRHDVPVELNGMSLPGAICSGHTQNIQAAVIGSITRPLLRLTNNSDRTRGFVLKSDRGPDLTVLGPLISITTLPGTPVNVPAGRRVDLRLLVTARDCPRDLTALAGLPHLTVEETSRNDFANSGVGVDVTALVGAAVAKACDQR